MSLPSVVIVGRSRDELGWFLRKVYRALEPSRPEPGAAGGVGTAVTSGARDELAEPVDAPRGLEAVEAGAGRHR